MSAEPLGTGQPQRPRRRSRQRELLLEYLEQERAFHTAQEIHAGLQGRGQRVGLATVYRTLQLLSETGEVDTLRHPGGEQRYRLCSTTDHHHHLTCTSCGTVLEFDDQPVRDWVDQLCAAAGFTAQHHLLEISGTCRGCATT